MRARSTLVFLVSLTLGCASPGFPTQEYETADDLDELKEHFDFEGLVDEYFKSETTADRKRELRDAIIVGRVALMNLHYNNFVRTVSLNRQYFNSGSQIAVLGLDLTATAVTAASTKTVLTAISSGITGSTAVVNEEFFYSKTVPVLVTAMEAGRNAVLVDIYKGQQESITKYPLSSALVDLQRFYFAGTFLGSLARLQSSAADEERKTSIVVSGERTKAYFAEERVQTLSALLDKIDQLSDARATELVKSPPIPFEPALLQLLSARGLTEANLDDGGNAKVALKMVLSYIDGTPEELRSWTAAVDSVLPSGDSVNPTTREDE